MSLWLFACAYVCLCVCVCAYQCRRCPQLQHVVAMGLGLQGTHTPNWQRLDLTCRHGEVHIPSVGNIDMTASGGKVR